MRRHRENRLAVLDTTTLVAVLLLVPLFASCASSASVPSDGAHPLADTWLLQRDQAEHVVLADCRDNSGVVSSQMAYFPGAPDSTPQDVAMVSTPPDETRLWADNTTSGLFTDTGTTFTAVLGPQVGQGDYAGTGDNGYGNFTCWETYQLDLYSYDGTTCSQVYDCNHSPAPASTSSAAPSSGSNSSGLVPGAEAAIIAGAVIAVLIAVGAFTFLWWRRRAIRRRRQAAALEAPSPPRAGFSSLFSRRSQPPTPSPQGAELFTVQDPAKEGQDAAAQNMVYELDGRWHGVEMHGDSRAELNAVQEAELEGKETPNLKTLIQDVAGFKARKKHGTLGVGSSGT